MWPSFWFPESQNPHCIYLPSTPTDETIPETPPGFLATFLTAAPAAAISRSMVYPFERAQLMFTLRTMTRETGSIVEPLYKELFNRGGFRRSLYKGLTKRAMEHFPVEAVHFACYHSFSHMYNNNLVAGALAGAIGQIIKYPFDFMKFHFNPKVHVSMAQALAHPHFYRNLFYTLPGSMVFRSLFFGIFDDLNVRFRPPGLEHTPLYTSFAAGYLAHLSGRIAVYPIDTVMMLIQRRDRYPFFAHSGHQFLDHVFHQRGSIGLLKNYISVILFHPLGIFGGAFTLTLFEFLRRSILH